MKKYLIVLFSFLFTFPSIAQNADNSDINSIQPEIVTLGIGTGYNSFFGDYLVELIHTGVIASACSARS